MLLNDPYWWEIGVSGQVHLGTFSSFEEFLPIERKDSSLTAHFLTWITGVAFS